MTEAVSLATKAVVEKTVDGYVVLDERTLRGERARYAGRRATAAGDMRRLETALRQSVLAQRLVTANVNPGLVDSVSRSRLELESERLTEHGRGTDASRRANMMFGAAVAFLLYMSKDAAHAKSPSANAAPVRSSHLMFAPPWRSVMRVEKGTS